MERNCSFKLLCVQLLVPTLREGPTHAMVSTWKQTLSKYLQADLYLPLQSFRKVSYFAAPPPPRPPTPPRLYGCMEKFGGGRL